MILSIIFLHVVARRYRRACFCGGTKKHYCLCVFPSCCMSLHVVTTALVFVGEHALNVLVNNDFVGEQPISIVRPQH